MLMVLIGFAILVFMYVLLTFEIMHRTAVAVLTAGIVLGLNIVLRYASFEDLLMGVDMDTILLLMSMMIIVGVLSRTGFFEYVASTLLRRFHKHPLVLVAVLCSFTGFVSAFIDNVTTVLLVTPIVIEMARRIGVDPRPLLLSIVFSSNIGGTATLIGDPPNIIIGSAAKLGFMDFVRNLTPIVVADLGLYVAMAPMLYRSWFASYRTKIAAEATSLEWRPSVDRDLLRKVGIVLCIVVGLFFLEDILGYPPAIPAIIGAGIVLIFVRKRMSLEEVLDFVDWSTLVFFISMFIAIRGIEEMGVVEFIARCIASTSRDLPVLLMVVLWLSAFVSALVDNIPFVMAMIPVVKSIATMLGIDPKPLYWALSLGGCLGGNGTLVGASANIVVAGIAEKHGCYISFRTFARYGMPVMLSTVGLAAIYLILRYGL